MAQPLTLPDGADAAPRRPARAFPRRRRALLVTGGAVLALYVAAYAVFRLGDGYLPLVMRVRASPDAPARPMCGWVPTGPLTTRCLPAFRPCLAVEGALREWLAR